MVSKWHSNYTKEDADRAQFHKLDMADPYMTPPLAELRENVDQLVYPERRKCFPDVYDGASQWYTTVERLSRKVTSQRHELWDVQQKLRAEVENSQALLNTLQLDRREHRDVVSALHMKIQYLEGQIKGGMISPVPGLTPQSGPELAPEPPRNSSEDVSASALEKDVEQLKQSNLALCNENIQLRALLRIDREMKSQANDGGLPDLKNPPAPAREQDAPRRPFASSTTETPKKSPFEEELKHVLRANEELARQLKAQSEEMAQQKSRFQYLQEVMERSLKTKTHHGHGGSSHRRSASLAASSPPPVEAPPLESSHASSSFSDSDTRISDSVQSLSRGMETPLPNQQSSVNRTMSTARADMSPSTPSIRKGSMQGHDRLETLLHRLRTHSIPEAELQRYEGIYNSYPQAFAERPRLETETLNLIHSLGERVSKTHAGVFQNINDSLDGHF